MQVAKDEIQFYHPLLPFALGGTSILKRSSKSPISCKIKSINNTCAIINIANIIKIVKHKKNKRNKTHLFSA